ncbi:MAG: hypothetical protein EA353_01180 [Puniceicoccaceae bacterium]|nr:MAG: hypothetical protein EA353_01180 [Puniceicoccaceae bacterium]
MVAVEEGLANLRDKPVLIAWGALDFCFTKAFMERWKTFFPEATVDCMEDCGHYVLEDGGPALHQRIRAFLAAK